MAQKWPFSLPRCRCEGRRCCTARHDRLLRTAVFLCWMSFVCPEPVLAKSSFLVYASFLQTVDKKGSLFVPQQMSLTSPEMSASMLAQPSAPRGGCASAEMADSGFSYSTCGANSSRN